MEFSPEMLNLFMNWNEVSRFFRIFDRHGPESSRVIVSGSFVSTSKGVSLSLVRYVVTFCGFFSTAETHLEDRNVMEFSPEMLNLFMNWNVVSRFFRIFDRHGPESSSVIVSGSLVSTSKGVSFSLLKYSSIFGILQNFIRATSRGGLRREKLRTLTQATDA